MIRYKCDMIRYGCDMIRCECSMIRYEKGALPNSFSPYLMEGSAVECAVGSKPPIGDRSPDKYYEKTDNNCKKQMQTVKNINSCSLKEFKNH